jgi:hypothetical protein
LVFGDIKKTSRKMNNLKVPTAKEISLCGVAPGRRPGQIAELRRYST